MRFLKRNKMLAFYVTCVSHLGTSELFQESCPITEANRKVKSQMMSYQPPHAEKYAGHDHLLLFPVF